MPVVLGIAAIGVAMALGGSSPSSPASRANPTSPTSPTSTPTESTAKIDRSGLLTPSAPPPANALPVAKLANITLALSPEAMAQATGAVVKRGDGPVSVEVPLVGGPYDRLTFAWDASDLGHVDRFVFQASAIVSTWASAKGPLGPRASDTGFQWDAVSASYDIKRWEASARVFDPSSPSTEAANLHWKPELDAVWDVVRNAMLGLNVPISEAEQRDWLGYGYLLASLDGFDPATGADHALAVVARAFPGVVARRTSDKLKLSVALDHPFCKQVDLLWPNAKGGRLVGAGFLWGDAGHRSDIERCLNLKLGEPTLHDEKTSATEWMGGHVVVYPGEVDVRNASRAMWKQLVNALADCGPP